MGRGTKRTFSKESRGRTLEKMVTSRVTREVRMRQRAIGDVRMTHIQTATRCRDRSLWPEPQKSRAEQTAGVAGLWRRRKLPQLRAGVPTGAFALEGGVAGPRDVNTRRP